MANKNEIVTAHSSIANNAFLTIQPTGAEQWLIQNIYASSGSAVELYRTDGTNDIKIQSSNNEGGWAMFKWFLTNGIYLKVKNVSGGTIYIGYDGIRMV